MKKYVLPLISISAFFVSAFAFHHIVLSHLGKPEFSTDLWGVPYGSSAPRDFCRIWLPAWSTSVVCSIWAACRKDPLFPAAVAVTALLAFPIAWEIWDLLHGPY